MLVLLVEDNRKLAANIIEYLEAEGFDCDYAERGDHGLALALSQHQGQPFEVIVLDLMLPGLDGMTVCRRLREEGVSAPVLMLTARDTLDDKLGGFDAGADDYLVKPFALPELVARLRALVKRRSEPEQELVVGDLRADLRARLVERAGRPIPLNPSCWTLLVTLMRASPAVLSREKLEAAVWGDAVPDSDALRSHLYQLRKAIDKPFDKPLLHTLRHVGVALRA
ncbi:response regulator transcription factor [Spongiibacter sp.]|uniref:response regulator transcription factor n=1 Tax=Spongiibacter sp. TaxID=2024860 RepID=UPI003566C5E6